MTEYISLDSISYTSSTTIDTLKPIFFKKFPTSSSDSSLMGYYVNPQGEDIGIISIDFFDGKIVLVDQYFNNLKVIDLESEAVLVGPSVGNWPTLTSGTWLSDVAAIKDLYIVTGLDSVFIFDKSLLQIASYKLPRGRKYVWNKTEDAATLFLDYSQKENLDITLDLCNVSYGKHDFFSEIIPHDEFTEWLKLRNSRGDRFTITSSGDNFLFSSEKISGIISTDISAVQEYDATSVFFNDSILCWFESYPDSLIVRGWKLELK